MSEVGGGVAVVGGREGSREAHSPFTDECPLGKLRAALVQQLLAASQPELEPLSAFWLAFLVDASRKNNQKPSPSTSPRQAYTSHLRTRSLNLLAILRG